MSEVPRAEQVKKAKNVARANKKGKKVKTHKTYFGVAIYTKHYPLFFIFYNY
jgi:hypothetical protein